MSSTKNNDVLIRTIKHKKSPSPEGPMSPNNVLSSNNYISIKNANPASNQKIVKKQQEKVRVII
jgi:hypothetical protein